MKCIISHPNIAPFIKESVIAYQEHGLVNKFYTTYFQHPDYPFTKQLIRFFPQYSKDFKRRNIEEIDYPLIKGNPFHEMIRIISARLYITWLENRIWEWNDRNFDRWVARNLDSDIQWVHTYEHAALATIRRAKALKMVTFYEQPSQHHDYLTKIIEEQLDKYPELINSTTRLMYNKRALKCDIRKDLELKECDYIICNSTFTLNTLTMAGISNKKVIMIPYGFPQTGETYPERSEVEKITFLFAGNQNLRKGIHILYQAWKECNFDPMKAELILIGESQLPQSLRKGLPSTIRFIQNIPHEELTQFYHKAHVFVLPTLADGFGMVISEAMSAGLPVITTRSSGGPDIIHHGRNGLLVEAGNIKALANELKWCFDHPLQLLQIGKNAFETAKAYPWSNYRKKLTEEVLSRVNEHNGREVKEC